MALNSHFDIRDFQYISEDSVCAWILIGCQVPNIPDFYTVYRTEFTFFNGVDYKRVRYVSIPYKIRNNLRKKKSWFRRFKVAALRLFTR